MNPESPIVLRIFRIFAVLDGLVALGVQVLHCT